MIRQGLIEIDLKQIESIHREERKKQEKKKKQIEVGQQQQDVDNNKKEVNESMQNDQYSIVREEIFPTKFTPFFIDNFTKQSALHMCSYDIKTINVENINKKLSVFYQIINEFQQSQRHQLASIFNLNEIKIFFQQKVSKNIQSQNHENITYFSYFQEGKSLKDIQAWRFKHRQDDPHISYEQRQSLFQNALLIAKFIDNLSATGEFQYINLELKDILVLQSQILTNQSGKRYQLRIKLKFILNFILLNQKHATKPNLLKSAQKILIKILSIQEQKDKQSKLEQYHINQIQQTKVISQILQLKYQQFYPNNKSIMQKNQPKQPLNKLQQSSILQNLKQEIFKLQELAKIEMKEAYVKIQQQPKIKFESQDDKTYFWNQIHKILLKNLTQSQRKNLILTSKKSTQIGKKSQGAKDNKSNIKENKGKETNKSANQSKNDEVTVQHKYLGSGSDLKFRPEKLIPLIEQKFIFYVLKVFNKKSNTTNHIGCYIHSKVSKQGIGILGLYFEDLLKKSFIYSDKSDLFYPLEDKSHAIGYGPQIFLSIGKLDIIIPCFGTQTINKKQMLKCISYFPLSYSSKGKPVSSFEGLQEQQINEKSQNKNTQNQIGLQKEFFLQDIDVYEINFKVR